MRQRSNLLQVKTCLIIGIAVVLAPFSYAQKTNVSVLEDLAIQCLAEVPDTLLTFGLAAPSQMPYLRTALVERWLENNRTVILIDSPDSLTHPILEYQVEKVQVDYRRSGRKRIRRTLTLALRYSLTGADGQLLLEKACSPSFTDTLDRSYITLVESDVFPETKGQVPEAGWIKRFLEPALLTAATALTVYLFFSLRSDKATSD